MSLWVLSVSTATAASIVMYGPTDAGESSVLAAAGHTVTVWNTSEWSAASTADFAAFDSIFMGDEDCSGPEADDLDVLFATRATWGAAVQGRIVSTTTDAQCHNGTNSTTDFTRNCADWVSGGGVTGAYFASEWGRRNMDFMSPFGTFSSDSSSGDDFTVTDTSHPIFSGISSSGMSSWGSTYHSNITGFPSDFSVVGTDGSGDALTIVRDVVDADGDGENVVDDCDDTDAAVNSSATEVCDGIDNDCDGTVDESDASDASTWYADADGDSYGNAADTSLACNQPSGSVADATDCDDTDGAVNPGVSELCNAVDDNCDGTVDEDSATDAATWYADSDGDSYGDVSTSAAACSQPSGYVADATDCDDTDGDANPGASEYCDGHDDDCDGLTDENDALDASAWFSDVDVDGYGDSTSFIVSCAAATGYVADATDCDDSDAAVNPAAIEVCDGLDNDCDGSADGADAVDALTWYLDYDQDGYGGAVLSTLACTQPQAYVANADDCDDTERNSYPGAPETCDGDDNDCDGSVDEADAVDGSNWYLDSDGDGYGDAASSTTACSAPSGYVGDDTDCDDTDADTWPGAEEFCDSVDTDCDGTLDEADATDATTWYADFDADGHGNATYTLDACDQPNGYVALDDDCNDLDSSSFPGGAEVCDLRDNDCDGTADEDDALDATTWYADADGDGFGDAAVSHVSCLAPGGYVEDNTDCDDAEASAFPGGAETWYDGIDGDCDGASDYDADTDGHDSDAHGGGDCDDTDPDLHPDADDAWYDGVDSNCDGASDFDADGDGFDSASYEGDDCDDGNADTYPGAPDEPHDGVINDCNHTSDDDADGDGFDSVDYGGDDCDDANSAIHPEAEETWYDGVDDNCDGNDDDQDGDGFGVEDDCDDLDATAYPGAPGWTEDCEPVPEDTGDTGSDTGSDTGGDTGVESEQPKGGGRCATVPEGGFAGFGLALLGAVLRRRRRVGQ